MPRFEDTAILMEEPNRFEPMGNDDFKFTFLASKKKDNDEDNDADDDDYIEEEEEEVEENPFDKEPTEKDIIDNNVPIIDPEDDLLDDDEEVPYN